MTEDMRPQATKQVATRWHRIARLLDASVTKIGAAVVLAVSVTSLVFSLVPRLKPADPQAVGVSVVEMRIQRDLSFWEYLAIRWPQNTIPEDNPLGQQVGIDVEVTLNVKGLAGRKIRMTGELLDARTSARPPPEIHDPVTYAEDSVRVGNSPEMDLPVSSWVPGTSRPGEYFIRVRFYLDPPDKRYRDRNGLLAVADSKQFRVEKR